MTDTQRYDVVRIYWRGGSRVVKRGLTHDEASAHCTSSESNYSTCREPVNIRRTKRLGPWGDVFFDAGAKGTRRHAE